MSSIKAVFSSFSCFLDEDKQLGSTTSDDGLVETWTQLDEMPRREEQMDGSIMWAELPMTCRRIIYNRPISAYFANLIDANRNNN